MAVDIVINETIDSVDITVNPNIIEVNVTRTSGGGGSQTLAQTLVLGRNTGGENILVNNADAIELENGSKLSQGIIDAGTGGNKGIALTCSVGYEWKWEAGEAYLTNLNNNTIDIKQYARISPLVTDDITKGYFPGSYWSLLDNTIFYCSDATEGGAIWQQVFGFVNLQQVTDNGNTITTDFSVITLGDDSVSVSAVFDPTLISAISAGGFLANGDTSQTQYQYNKIYNVDESTNNFLEIKYPTSIVSTNKTQTFQDATGTIALTSDIPDAGVPYMGATADLDLGLFNLKTAKVFLYDEPNDNYGSLHYTDGNFHIEDADGHKLFVIEDGFLQLHLTDLIQSNLLLSNLTAIRDHYLPNESGTIALTSIVADAITNGVTDKAPSQNAVFDALALKQDELNISTGLTDTSGTITNNLSIGVAGGQTLNGGIASGDSLLIEPTTNSTKGVVKVCVLVAVTV
jgi:hypothetical protein